MVQEINFSGNIITAKVKGSRRTPYSETIKLPEFSQKDIDKLINLIQEQPVVLSKLFNRQLDESLAKMPNCHIILWNNYLIHQKNFYFYIQILQ